jgi:uncharacterized protein (DUF1501 family)
MAHSRREFIKRGVTFVGAGLVAPRLLVEGSGVARAEGIAANRTLVIVELAGGNDGLNTIVPYADSRYYAARPGIAIPRSSVLPITDAIGLHPNLAPLEQLYRENKVAIVQGVGYPRPDLSHFRSTEIWQTAVPDTIGQTGWIGRYLDTISEPGSEMLDAISVGYETPPTLVPEMATGVAAIESFDSYVFRGDAQYPADDANKRAAFAGLYDDARGSGSTLDFVASTGLLAYESSGVVQQAASAYVPAVPYAEDPFSQNMLKIAKLLDAGLGTNVFYTSFGSFDTHASQLGDHGALLAWLANGLSSFYRDMAAHGRAGEIAVMTFSEFGRRVNQNESGGTDHGTAGPMLLVGDAVGGGVYGEHPSLGALDENGNLEFGIDFRAVYATVLGGWLGADAEPILGGRFEDLGIF